MNLYKWDLGNKQSFIQRFFDLLKKNWDTNKISETSRILKNHRGK